MKTLLIRLLPLLLLVVSSTKSFAQLDLKFSETFQKEYVSLDDFESEISIPQNSERIDLGFELESYGVKCSGIYVSDSYFFFDWMGNYSVEVIPIGLFDYAIDRSKGSYRIKHIEENGLKSVVIEARNLEYEGLPGQKLNYQLAIREDSRITIHYGENTLNGNHPLSNGMGYVVIVEEDFEKAQANPNSEDDYYRSIVNPFGDPSAPSLNVLPVANKLNKYPDPNTLYSVYRTSFASVDAKSVKTLPQIFPNPGNGRLKINLNGYAFTRIDLVDVTGKTRASIASLAGLTEVSIDTHHLPSGQYFVRMLNGEDLVQVQKVILQ